MKNFILAPFRALKSMWKEGPGGQWVCVVFFFIFLIFLILPVKIAQDYIENSVKTGIVIEKWYRPEYQQWTGKTFITVPASWNLFVKGKNILNKEVVSQKTVSDYTFFNTEVGEKISFE